MTPPEFYLPMERFRDGRWYSTARADRIDSHTHGAPGDPDFFEEVLYRLSAGDWFLIGRGGAESPWGVRLHDGTRAAAKNLRALTDAKASKWQRARAEARRGA